MEDDCDSEAVFAMGDRPPWTTRRPPDASGVPTLQQMFTLARPMGYEMCPIARQTDAPRQQTGFDLIECFTTTFLRAHSWLNWVDEDDDEDEVGLKEKPEDTRYIKKITSK